MTTFVILAAGRGTRMGRVGEALHKCLTPLDGKALISHQLDLAPPDAKIVVVVGHKARQVQEYLELAHPQREIHFVTQNGGGPGAALHAAQPYVTAGEPLVYAACDTLWQKDHSMWTREHSWAGVAPIPAGTDPARWCRMVTTGGVITKMIDKKSNGGRRSAQAFVGLAYIIADDQYDFWRDLMEGHRVAKWTGDEWRDVEAFDLLIDDRRLRAQHVHWIDVGDEDAYRRAVAQVSGYDWTKIGEATYLLPCEGQVVKFHSNRSVIDHRVERARLLGELVPQPVTQCGSMMAYPYVPGVTAYKAAYQQGTTITSQLLRWWSEHCWQEGVPAWDGAADIAYQFYRDKSKIRAAMLTRHLFEQVDDLLDRVDWDRLCQGVLPGPAHLDLNHGNVIYNVHGKFTGIDWREDFAGQVWGDLRYDLGKLLAGTIVDWEGARRGDFRPWAEGPRHAQIVRSFAAEVGIRRHVEIIGALSLLNSAPLHAAPLDEILVARGAAWLEEALA